MAHRILIVDDEPTVRTLFGAALTSQDMEVYEMATGAAAVEFLEEITPDLIFCDIRMPGMTGLDFLELARELCPDVPVVLVTAFADKEYLVRAVQLGAFDFIEKPFQLDALLLVVQRALRQRELLVGRRQSEAQTARVEALARRLNATADLTALYRLLEDDLSSALGVRGFRLYSFLGDRPGLRLEATDTTARVGAVSDDESVIPYGEWSKAGFDPLASGAAPEPYVGEKLAVIPLAVRDQLLGLLELVEKLEPAGPIGAQDLAWWTIAAQHLASAVEVRRRGEELQGALDRLAATQQALVRSERLAAISKLVAGVAHELKNPLTSLQFAAANLRGVLERWKTEGQDIAPATRFLDSIDADVGRLRHRIDRFMTVVRPGHPRREACNPAEVVMRIYDEIRGRIEAEGVRVQVDCDPGLPTIQLDPEGFERAVRNLVVNAIEAVGDGGRIALRVKNGLDVLRVEVEDSGPGVPADAVADIFNMFFTLKPSGTGIGLSQVQVFCDTHGGRVTYDPERRPTCFVLEVPVPELQAGDEA